MKKNCPGGTGYTLPVDNTRLAFEDVTKSLSWPYKPLWKPRWKEGEVTKNTLLYLKVNHPTQADGDPNEIIPTNLSALLLVLIIGYICYKIKPKREI